MKRMIAFLTAFMLICLQIPCAAIQNASDFSIGFDTFVTNKTQNFVDVESSIKAIVVDDGYKNKALRVTEIAALTKNVTVADNTVTFSMDIKTVSDSVSGSMGFKTSEGEYLPLKISSNDVYTVDGKKLGAINNQVYSKLSITLDLYRGMVMLGVSKNSAVEREISFNGEIEAVLFNLSSGTVLADNISFGEDGRKAQKAYNEERVENIDIEYLTGDFTYFNSWYLNPSSMAVAKQNNIRCSPYPKTNEIIFHRCIEYKNKNFRSDIEMIKKTSDDCFFDVQITHDSDEVQRVDKYILMEADITPAQLGAPYTIMVRKAVSGTPAVNQNIFKITAQGTAEAADGSQFAGLIKEDKKFNLRVFFDLSQHTADYYVDDVLVKENVALNGAIDMITLIRFGFSSGNYTGALSVDRCFVRGLMKEYSTTEDYRTSVFYDDTPVAQYAADKIIFNGYRKNVTVNNEKQMLDDLMIFENDTIYVREDKLKEISKTDKSLDDESFSITVDGEKYTDAALFFTECLDKYTFRDENGMLIISDKSIGFDTDEYYKWLILKPNSASSANIPTVIELLNDYSFFDRPDKTTLKELYKEKNASHPRLLITKERVEELKSLLEKGDKEFLKMWEPVIKEADGYTAQKAYVEYKHDDTIRMYNQANVLRRKMASLGIAYQLTGDKKYFDRMWPEIEEMSTWQDLNVYHVIDAGMFGQALAYAYDMFYDAFSDEQRATVQRIIKELVLEDFATIYWGDVPRSHKHTRASTNFNTFINCGIITSAVMMMDAEPDLAARVLECGLRSIEYTLKGFAPTGGWLEGPTYWDLTWRALMPIIESLSNSFGTDFGISDFQGLKDSGYYMVAAESNIGGSNNYHDSHIVKSMTSWEYTYFGYKYGQKGLSELRKHALDNLKEFKLTGPAAYDIFFYNAESTKEDMDNLPTGLLLHGPEVVGIRKNYTKDNDFYIGAHAGNVSGYHTHNDVGTFVFDMLGERWAIDCGIEDYNITNVSGVKEEDTYRRRTEGHNTLVIDNDAYYNQIKNSFAPAVKFETKKRGAFVIYDLSDCYKKSKNIQRGIAATDDFSSITLRDEVSLEKPGELYWFWHTNAECTIVDNKTVIMRQNGREMKLDILVEGSPYELYVMDAVPLEESPKPSIQNKNEGIRKVTIKINNAQNVNITAKAYPSDEEKYALTNPKSLSDWNIPDGDTENTAKPVYTVLADGEKISDNALTINVKVDGSLPEITVDAQEQGYRYEISKATTAEGSTVIRVYDNNNRIIDRRYFTYSDFDRPLLENYNILDIDVFEVSSEPEAVNAGENMFDSSYDTHWTCMALGENVKLDLGKESKIDALALAFWKGNERAYSFTVYASKDGVKYEKVADCVSSKKSTEYEVFPVPQTTARYLKVVCNGSDVNSASNVNANINELRVLSSK